MTEVRLRSGPPRGSSVSGPLSATIVFTTGRREPRLDWLIDAVDAQSIPGDDLQLVVIDAAGRRPSEIGFRSASAISDLTCSPPKPTIWQGPQRVTDRDWWAASSARNTGIVLASRDYVMFVDDRMKLGDQCLARVRAGASVRDSVLCGSYDYLDDPRVVVDHRRVRCPGGRRDCGGGWLYSGLFSLPLAWLLEVNGFEEGCDGVGMEDVILGHMLSRRGRRLDFDALMRGVKERLQLGDHHHRMWTCDKNQGRADSKTRAALVRFGCRRRTELTPDLRAIRSSLARGGSLPDVDASVEHRDWYDGQLIREMVPY